MAEIGKKVIRPKLLKLQSKKRTFGSCESCRPLGTTASAAVELKLNLLNPEGHLMAHGLGKFQDYSLPKFP